MLSGQQEPDARTGTLVSHLHAANVLPAVLTQDLRPATGTKELLERARGLILGGWEPQEEAATVLAGALVTKQAWQGAGRNTGRF